MEILIDWPLSRETVEVVSDPSALHRRAMSYLPNLEGRSRAIRADTGTQFRVDLPTDPLGRPGTVTLRVRSEALAPDVGTRTELPPLSTDSRVVVRLAAEKRNTVNGRVRTRAVSDDEAPAWAEALLLRHGLRARDPALSSARRFGREKRTGFWVRDLLSTVEVVESARAETAISRGIGRGRSYGLGMIVPLPHNDCH